MTARPGRGASSAAAAPTKPDASGSLDRYREIEGHTAEEIDRLPYGVILLDRSLVVRGFNRAESAQSGFPASNVIGKPFFEVVAPCANVPEFRERVEQVVHGGAGHSETFRYVYNRAGARPRPVTITVYGALNGGAWIVAT